MNIDRQIERYMMILTITATNFLTGVIPTKQSRLLEFKLVVIASTVYIKESSSLKLK